MIHQNSVYSSELIKLLNIGYYDTIQILIWCIFIILSIILATRLSMTFVFQGKTKGEISEKTCISLTLFSLAISRIPFIISFQIEFYYDFLNLLGYSLTCTAMIPTVISIENWKLFRTKKIFSILEIIMAGYCIFISITTVLNIELLIFDNIFLIQIISILSSAIPFLLYITLFKGGIGLDKKEYSLMLMGFLFIIIGLILTMDQLLFEFYGKPILRILFYINPVFFFVGAILISKIITPKGIRI